MNGPQHYAEAEHQLRLIEKKAINSEEIAARMAKAQVHATLALVAATVEANDLESMEIHGNPVTTDWFKAMES